MLILLSGWSYLFVMAQSVNLTTQNEIRAQLAQLKSIDTRWNDRLLNLREAVGSPRDTDFVAPVTPTTLSLTQHELAVRAQVLANPIINQTLADLKRSFNQKVKAVEQFSAANKGLNEAIARFNQASARVATPGSGRLPLAVNALLAQPSAANAKQVVQVARELQAEGRINDAHAQLAISIAELKIPEDRAFRVAVFDSSIGERIETLSRTIDREFQKVVDDGERYRVYLLFYSAFLLLVASFLGSRLLGSVHVINRMNERLKDANEGLERRVSERTRELEKTLSQLKESEAMLIQSEKMASLGQMVAGVAHEINTPLAYVKSSLESVDQQIPQIVELNAKAERLLGLLGAEDVDEAELATQFSALSAIIEQMRASHTLPDLHSLVKDGMHGIGQIADLVVNLRNFARLDRSRVDEFDLNEGILSALAMTRNLIKHKTVRQELGALPRIRCSPSQINQVLLNLITNAAQATKDDASGMIVVRTGTRDGGMVAIEVEDNGHGIPEQVLPKIFDPFFTTKDVGKGSGLGLSIVYKIVEQHGGRVTVVSKVGVGTRFTVLLPLAADDSGRAGNLAQAA